MANLLEQEIYFRPLLGRRIAVLYPLVPQIMLSGMRSLLMRRTLITQPAGPTTHPIKWSTRVEG